MANLLSYLARSND